MDGAMWGLLRACSCLCPCSKGLGLVTSLNRHGMGAGEGGRDGQTKDEEGSRLKRGRLGARKVAMRPPQPDSHLHSRSKNLKTLRPNRATGQEMTLFFIC